MRSAEQDDSSDKMAACACARTGPVVPVDGSAEFHEPATTGSAAARLAAFGTPGDTVRLGACYAYARWRRRRMICSRPRHVELLCCAPLMFGRFRGGDALACHQRIPRRCFASSSSLSLSNLLTQGRPKFIPCVNL